MTKRIILTGDRDAPRRVRRPRLGSKAVIVLGAAVLFVLGSIVAVGALNHPRVGIPVVKSGGTTIVRWRVPHGETSAPVVPVAGGSTRGQGGFNGVSCPTETECVAVGGDASLEGVASTTSDGGSTWVQGAMAVGEPELLAVDCPSFSVCVAVGEGASVESSNAGATWHSASLPSPNTTLLGVSCPTVKLCVSVGVSPGADGPYQGQLLVSANGGTSWSSASLPASAGALGSVDCASAKFCVAVGASIVVSNNGGKTWSVRGVNGGTGVLRSVSCNSPTTCVAIGPNPTEAQNLQAAAYDVTTSDGGANWTSVPMPPSSASLNVVTCVSGSNCEAAGSTFGTNPSHVYTTNNGGSSWSSTSGPASALTGISGVSCASAGSCVYVGTRGGSPVVVGNGNQVWTGQSLAPQVRRQKALYR